MYSDKELQEIYEQAVGRNDKTLAAAIIAVATSRLDGADDEFLHLLTMFSGYLITKHEAMKKGDQENGQSHSSDPLTRIGPDTIIQL